MVEWAVPQRSRSVATSVMSYSSLPLGLPRGTAPRLLFLHFGGVVSTGTASRPFFRQQGKAHSPYPKTLPTKSPKNNSRQTTNNPLVTQPFFSSPTQPRLLFMYRIRAARKGIKKAPETA
jgi:hypothetical protein